jgi:hypothetical protein
MGSTQRAHCQRMTLFGWTNTASFHPFQTWDKCRQEQSVPLPKNRPFAFSLKRRQLQPQREIFDSDGLMPAA